MSNRILLKTVSWLIALTLVALPVIGVLEGWFAANRWPVRYLQVEAEYNHVSAEQIRAAATTQLGKGFFALDLDDVRVAVARLPWVASVEARKRWPDTLILRVRERQPFARWGAGRLIDRDGSLFAVPGGDVLQGLPQLDGPDDAQVLVVDFYSSLVRRFSGSGLILSGVSLSPRGSWTLTLANGAQILLGHKLTDLRLSRFLAVLPQLTAAHPGGFQHADLRYSNGFAVSWAASPAPAAPASDSSKTGAPPAAKPEAHS
ncbi:MAG: cell division protein FtsQ/DivIB [Xanthomonadaceae bacterium]|nr:cell division protein FtsQ/DivIB [Xanthomonadaceae bacterium]